MSSSKRRSLPTRSTAGHRGLGDVLQQAIEFDPGATAAATADALLPGLLDSVRLHMGMEIGFISRFEQGERIFEFVSSDPTIDCIEPGDSDPLESSYCQRVIDGAIPGIIRNAQLHPGVQDLPVTQDMGIGAHISVPVFLDEGTLYGTFCCFSFQPNEALDDRDIAFMSVVADLIGAILERESAFRTQRSEMRQLLDDVVETGAMYAVWQPIVDTATGDLTSVEALTRFDTEPYRPPNEWFEQAIELGEAVKLERNALARGMAILPKLPARTRISCNLSGQAVLDPSIQEFLLERQLDRVTVEITEHDTITDYQRLIRAIKPLRDRGMKLAIDDFGAGYASFRHIVGLDPDIIKIDMSLVRGIDRSKTARSIVRALCRFARSDDRALVAEGVETEAEMDTLQRLGVSLMQGYLLHKPMGRDDLARLLASH